MWHEARKHERKLRGMMVDYKKRAERRREYYEKIVSIFLLGSFWENALRLPSASFRINTLQEMSMRCYISLANRIF